MHRRRARFSFFTMLAAITLASLVGCTTNPATGQSQFNILSTSQEVSLGEQAAPEFQQEYGGPIPSPAIRDYVADLGLRLAAVSERPDLPWEFHVVDSSVINAFALPGGKVFISRGLLEKLTNEAQLAGVLGHEVGHVTAQHIGQQMSQAMAIQLGVAGLGVAAQTSESDWLRVLGLGAQVAGPVYLLSYGRNQEVQADDLALRYMARLGYNPIAQMQVMQILAENGGSGAGPEFLSTHPYPESRVANIQAEINRNYRDANEEGRYSFEAERFRTEVLDRLANLPPARHTGQ